MVDRKKSLHEKLFEALIEKFVELPRRRIEVDAMIHNNVCFFTIGKFHENYKCVDYV